MHRRLVWSILDNGHFENLHLHVSDMDTPVLYSSLIGISQ